MWRTRSIPLLTIRTEGLKSNNRNTDKAMDTHPNTKDYCITFTILGIILGIVLAMGGAVNWAIDNSIYNDCRRGKERIDVPSGTRATTEDGKIVQLAEPGVAQRIDDHTYVIKVTRDDGKTGDAIIKLR